MGFGILLTGYFMTYLMSVSLFGYLIRFIGYGLMLYSFTKLKNYHKAFTLPLAAAGVMLLGYLLYAEVLRENTYLSRTIEVQEGQRVIDSGLYGIVRHPMYSATLLLFLAMPLVLGSLIALPIFLLYIPIIVARLLGEEKLLEAELPGYREYMKKVRWRLIPFVF